MDRSLAVRRIDEATRQIGIPAWGIVVTRDHQELLRHVSGYADEAQTQPFTDHHFCWLYSLTKVATCTAAVQLIERGALRLEDEVADYLPAFAHPQVLENGALRPAKRPITVLDLFTMRSGLDYDLNGLASEDATNDELIDRIAARPLHFDPGERFQYSLSHDALAGVIAKAAHMPYRDWLHTALLDPLGMTETDFIATTDERTPFCAQYDYRDGQAAPRDFRNEFVLSPVYCSGGAGLATTLRDYSKLLDALANEGVGANGVRILQPQSVRMIAQNRLNESQTRDYLAWRREYSYGLGMRTRMQDAASNPHGYVEFGWDGAAGAYGMADVTNHLSVTYLQHVRGCAPAYDVLHYVIRDAVYEALGLL